MARTRTYLAAALSLSSLALISAASVGGQRPQPPANVKAGKFYKNIKLLKELPANRVIPVMQQISAQLGVRCDFCHDVTRGPGGPTGFEKDTKKYKNIARQMMVMTQDINKRHKVLQNKVTCYTCHHGKPEPENQPPARSGPPR